VAPLRQGARFPASKTVDFAIVGSGAAGGIIARELATAGCSVVVLEQGPRLTEAQFDHDEFGAFMQSKNCNSPATQPHTFRASTVEKARPSQTLVYGRLVGGSNAHFSGNFWRLRPSDFHEASRLGGVAGTGLTDWPIDYDELEPYYTKAEWELGVSGEPGPFDPPVAAVSDAAAAGEVERRAPRARRPRARPPSPGVADGDQLTAVSRASGLPTLRLLHVLHVRVPREVDVDGHHAARRRGNGPL
jgi:choline dehydrogenase-like flavoprotein